MTEAQAALVYCPFPDKNTAKAISQTLLEEKLIACANITTAVESVFEWDGAVTNSQEVAVLFKSTAKKLDQLVTRLGDCHPYETPAIFGWKCDTAHPVTLQWLDQVLS